MAGKQKKNARGANAKDVEVKALFLGPKSENREYFKNTLNFLMEEHMHWRRDFHPEDADVASVHEMRSEHYQETLDRTSEVLSQLSAKLKATSMPWFSARYLGHMNSDTLMVANLAYMATLLYNPNNVAYEASTATTPMEIEVGKDLATMLGFDPKTSWGHITTDGTIANYEGLWMARNLKSFPLAIKKVKPSLVKGMDDWQLLNMPTQKALDLIEKVKKAGCFDAVRNETVRGTGVGEGKLGVVLIPQSKHYSWVKAADVLGIGNKNFVEVQVDEHFRMDIGVLKKTIDAHVAKKIPIIAVVGVVGTTEEGAIDRIAEIAKLRDEYRKKGISFYFHVDAAYGGYSRALFLDEKSRFMEYGRLKRRLFSDKVFVGNHSYPAKEIYESYKAIPAADSITIDPHKMGYIPYAAGGIAIKDRRILDLISYFAAYVFESGKSSPVLLGAYIMEGSKAGATAAAVWASHRVIPLNITGYGEIIGRSIEGAQMFTRALEATKSLKVKGREFLVQPLVQTPDFNIICMAFNEKGNMNLERMNALNSSIYSKSSYVSGPVYKNDWITSNTELSREDYGDAPKGFVKRLGIPEKEWDRVGRVRVLRVCMLNPFISNFQNHEAIWKGFLEILKKKIEESVS
ncbi:tyrosine decarboxylase [Candidatus Micrarchaeota archaeon]|nr:tyrosine decarboxylase [Candidatus Micrarchaeota archaeon]